MEVNACTYGNSSGSSGRFSKYRTSPTSRYFNPGPSYAVTAAATGGYSYTFTVNVKNLSSVSVTAPPTVTTYNFGEMPDYRGIVVTATYSDGTTAPVTAFTTSGYSRTSTGEQIVTVNYFGKQATFTVTTIKVSEGTITTGLSYTFNSGTGRLMVGGTMPAGCTVYIAGYDTMGKMICVSTIHATNERVDVGDKSKRVKIFLLNAQLIPQCEAITISL